MRVAIANWHGAIRPRFRKLEPFGLCYHMTGRTIVERAESRGVEPIVLALKWWSRQGGVHFGVDYDGTIYQMLDTETRGAHVGLPREWRGKYLSGEWKSLVRAKGHHLPLDLWEKRWPSFPSPQHMFPGKSPNGAYLGVEFLPLLGTQADGTRFTDAQYAAGRALFAYLSDAHGWHAVIEARIAQSRGRGHRRAPAHEDLTPHSRWQPKGGWDTGALRLTPRWNWDKVLG